MRHGIGSVIKGPSGMQICSVEAGAGVFSREKAETMVGLQRFGVRDVMYIYQLQIC